MGASGVPIPLVNYVELIRSRKSPYCDTVQFLLRDMETHYLRTGQGSETVYAVNPKILQEEVEKIINDDRLTTVNVCRTILALLYGSDLSEEKDFYVTTTSSGRRNCHIKVNNRTLTSMNRML
jgi:hypothetical protein